MKKMENLQAGSTNSELSSEKKSREEAKTTPKAEAEEKSESEESETEDETSSSESSTDEEVEVNTSPQPKIIESVKPKGTVPAVEAASSAAEVLERPRSEEAVKVESGKPDSKLSTQTLKKNEQDIVAESVKEAVLSHELESDKETTTLADKIREEGCDKVGVIKKVEAVSSAPVEVEVCSTDSAAQKSPKEVLLSEKDNNDKVDRVVGQTLTDPKTLTSEKSILVDNPKEKLTLEAVKTEISPQVNLEENKVSLFQFMNSFFLNVVMIIHSQAARMNWPILSPLQYRCLQLQAQPPTHLQKRWRTLRSLNPLQ